MLSQSIRLCARSSSPWTFRRFKTSLGGAKLDVWTTKRTLLTTEITIHFVVQVSRIPSQRSSGANSKIEKKGQQAEGDSESDVSIEEETHQGGEPTGAGGAITTTGACAYMPLMGVAKIWKPMKTQVFSMFRILYRFAITLQLFVAGGDLSADDSSSASTATNQPAPVRRRASISRKEADHVEESIAKQQQDVGAREVLEDVYLNLFELLYCLVVFALATVAGFS